MIEDSGKRGNTMAERRQLFAEMKMCLECLGEFQPGLPIS
uniref:Dystrobrevin alpha n=1 Tax=Homo sapiens TaxID=9606 RepID=K7ESB2_HUMAN